MGRRRKILDAADMMTVDEARAAVAATMALKMKEQRRMKGGQLGDALRSFLSSSAPTANTAPREEPAPPSPRKP